MGLPDQNRTSAQPFASTGDAVAVKGYEHVFSAGRIGKLELRNRIIVTAMGVNLAETDGTCGARIRAYHEEQAKGGAGLINTGTAGVAWPVGGNQPGQVAISDDRFIPGIAAMVDAVHSHGAKFSLQLHHGGAVAMQDMLAGRPVWVPSLPEPASDRLFCDGAQAACRSVPADQAHQRTRRRRCRLFPRKGD